MTRLPVPVRVPAQHVAAQLARLRLPGPVQGAAVLGAAVGVVGAGAVAGAAGGRIAGVRRARRRSEAQLERLAPPRGVSVPVPTDDGVLLHAEVDEVAPGGAAGEGASFPGGEATVVLCHGYGLTLDAFSLQRHALRGAARLVLWDQRGHGRSGRGAREHATIDQLGRDLAAVVATLAPNGPLVLVGHSMGGMTILALADQQPTLFGDRVVGVALLSTSPGRLAEVTLGVPAAMGRLLHRVAPHFVAALARTPHLVERGRRLGSDLEYLITKRYSFATDVPPEVAEFAARMISSTPVDVLAELFPAFAAHDKLRALDALAGTETLLLVGAEDLVTPPDHSRDMLQRVPHAELVVVPDAGHLVLLEHPEVVSRHLAGLLDRVRRGGAAA